MLLRKGQRENETITDTVLVCSVGTFKTTAKNVLISLFKIDIFARSPVREESSIYINKMKPLLSDNEGMRWKIKNVYCIFVHIRL